MKKFFSFITIVAIISLSNCSRINENNDPIIGIWSNLSVTTASTAKNRTVRQEWIFNDAYLGRYHTIENGSITIKTDFSWKQEDGLYTISYPGLERADDIVSLKAADDETMLEHRDGYTLAKRE
ncbi:MAG: hypothetical protein COC08_09330 [Maribacter sp.]|nr:MAG: hypothetical protein COC08_09330 [Maribacter sp.]